MSFLQQRGGVWWFRRMVPRRLRPIIGKLEVRESLKTGEYEVAKRRAVAVLARIERDFAEAEQARKNPAVAVYKALQQDAEDRADRERRGVPRTDDDEEGFDGYLIDKLEADERGERKLSSTERAVALALLKRNDNGNVSPPLSILFDRYRVDRRLPAKSWLEWHRALSLFTASIGGDLPANAVTTTHVRAWKASLKAMTSERTGKPLSHETIQKLMNALHAVFAWAVQEGHLETNPAAGVSHVKKTKGALEKPRIPYSADDLATLFSPDAMKARREAGHAMYWLPIMALYSGCRMEELGGLKVDDVGVEDGFPYFAIQPSDVRSVKTKSSVRRVPLHPEVSRLGFLDFVKAQRDAGHTRLFPELRPTSYGSNTAAFSKWWGRQARSFGIADPRRTFHSFRHGFKDACRRAGISEEVHDALTGHANGSVGRRYGFGVPLPVLAEAIKNVRFSGLDL